jgi:HK97 family phage prohead protease
MILRNFQKNGTVATRMTAPLELRFEGSAGGIEGYASAFGGPPDSYGDIIERGAFKRTIGDHKREGTMPAMLWAHDPTKPIGRWTDIREDDFGLYVRGSLNLDTSGGKDAHQHLKHGDATGLSIGFVIPQSGARQDGATTILTDIDLMEVSAVVFPANRRARVSGVKALQSKSDLIDMLREGGLPKAAAARIAAGGWPALAGDDHQKAIELAAAIKRATADLRRT